MNFSEDVLKLNPDLRREARAYLPERKRLLIDDGFDSDLERDFNAELLARGWEVRPHGWTFHLPGGVDYTPDFIAWRSEDYLERRHVMVYEVKGNMRQKNARDSRTRFKIAAGLYAVLEFYWVTRDRGGRWIETRHQGQ